jgi:hypothetical protein
MTAASVMKSSYFSRITSTRTFEFALKAVLTLNVIDALSTLYWVQAGMAVESNPIMAGALAIGPAAFICMKIALVSLAVVLLSRMHESTVARVAVLPLVLLYSFIDGGHVGFALANALDIVPPEYFEMVASHAAALG